MLGFTALSQAPLSQSSTAIIGVVFMPSANSAGLVEDVTIAAGARVDATGSGLTIIADEGIGIIAVAFPYELYADAFSRDRTIFTVPQHLRKDLVVEYQDFTVYIAPLLELDTTVYITR